MEGVGRAERGAQYFLAACRGIRGLRGGEVSRLNHDDLERRLFDLIPRLERITLLQEQAEERCERRLERIREIEDHQDTLDAKISALQKQNAVLSETLDAFRSEHKKLCKLIRGMIALLVLILMVLSFIGVEAFPFLFEVVKKLVI